MNIPRLRALVARGVAVAVAIPFTVSAQRPDLPPIHPIGRIEATADSFSNARFRLLSDGRVLVSDAGHNRVVLLDANLQNPKVTLDTSSTARLRYPAFGGSLSPFRGDTTLMQDEPASSLLVLDENGAPVRSIHTPQNRVGPWDPAGRLYYLGPSRSPKPTPLEVGAPNPAIPDSQPLVRVSLTSSQVDTIAMLRAADRFAQTWRTMENGVRIPAATLPLRSYSDIWAVLSDGTVAVVRAHDYHIDWIAPDGTRSSSPRLAYTWSRIPDSVTATWLDSLRREEANRPSAIYTYVLAGEDHCQRLSLGYPDADQIPDYPSPLGNKILLDPAGNLWIQESVGVRPFLLGASAFSPLCPLPPAPKRTASPPPPETIYDVVNRAGRVIDRVALPSGTELVAVGTGEIYLISSLGNAMVSLAKVRIR